MDLATFVIEVLRLILLSINHFAHSFKLLNSNPYSGRIIIFCYLFRYIGLPISSTYCQQYPKKVGCLPLQVGLIVFVYYLSPISIAASVIELYVFKTLPVFESILFTFLLVEE